MPVALLLKQMSTQTLACHMSTSLPTHDSCLSMLQFHCSDARGHAGTAAGVRLTRLSLYALAGKSWGSELSAQACLTLNSWPSSLVGSRNELCHSLLHAIYDCTPCK